MGVGFGGGALLPADCKKRSFCPLRTTSLPPCGSWDPADTVHVFVVIPATAPSVAAPGALSQAFVFAVFAALCLLDGPKSHPMTTALEAVTANWAVSQATLAADTRLSTQLEFLHAVCYLGGTRGAAVYTLGMYPTGFGKTLLALLPARVLESGELIRRYKAPKSFRCKKPKIPKSGRRVCEFSMQKAGVIKYRKRLVSGILLIQIPAPCRG